MKARSVYVTSLVSFRNQNSKHLFVLFPTFIIKFSQRSLLDVCFTSKSYNAVSFSYVPSLKLIWVSEVKLKARKERREISEN